MRTTYWTYFLPSLSYRILRARNCWNSWQQVGITQHNSKARYDWLHFTTCACWLFDQYVGICILIRRIGEVVNDPERVHLIARKWLATSFHIQVYQQPKHLRPNQWRLIFQGYKQTVLIWSLHVNGPSKPFSISAGFTSFSDSHFLFFTWKMSRRIEIHIFGWIYELIPEQLIVACNLHEPNIFPSICKILCKGNLSI